MDKMTDKERLGGELNHLLWKLNICEKKRDELDVEHTELDEEIMDIRWLLKSGGAVSPMLSTEGNDDE